MDTTPRITDYVTDPDMKSALDKVLFDGQEPDVETKAILDQKMRQAAEEIAEGLRRDADELYSKAIKEKLAEVSEGLSLAYIANRYFGKSKEWLYQRLNGSTVNGKQAGFKREEVVQLQMAIRDFGNKLSTVTLI